jgi:hypothetical protein
MCAHEYRSILFLLALVATFLTPVWADTTTGLVCYWKLDDGAGLTAADSVGGNNGKLQGDAAWAEGFAGGSVVLDGAGDYIDCGNKPAYNITDAVTLAAWVQARGDFVYPDWSGIIMRGGANIDTYSLYYNGTSKQLGFKTTGTTPNWFSTGTNTTTALFDGDWHHVAATYDGKTKIVYLDGVAIGNSDSTGKIETSTGRLLLGAGRDTNPPTLYLAGRIDEARLYNRGLSAADVKALVPPKLQARQPNPADGAVGILTPLFGWTAGDTAVFHNFYIGKSPNLGAADLAGNRVPVAMFFYVAGLEPGVTYYWRVDEVEADGKTVHTGNVWSFTVQALTAYLPAPADGAVDVSPTPTLTWQPGQAAVKHHVYFSAGLDAVKQRAAGADKGEAKDATFKPGTLEALTTYYWAVDETVSGNAIKAGPVWTFTTYLSIDDFESYTDDKGKEIFSTWIDGWTNGSGSQVGYTTAPFAERTIVHSGVQAMPMEYNDVKSPNYSAAARTFNPTVDWTVNGADKLVLFVRGKTANKPVQLYVAIDDAAGHNAWTIPFDDTPVTTTKWYEWRIPVALYTELGVNMARVKKITIGVYDHDKSPGATGTLYFDDIRLIRSTGPQ